MAKKFPLQPLIDLAQDQLDEAARQLSKSKADWQKAEDRLNQVAGFRAEYYQRREQLSQTSIPITMWKDYYKFLTRLDDALTVQVKEVEKSQQRWEKGLEVLKEKKVKLNAMSALLDRHHRQEEAKENKREQKLNDEFGTRAANTRARNQPEE